MKVKKGDFVYLVAPGGFIKDPSIIHEAEKLLGKWGLKVKKGKHILKKEGHFSGSDKERTEDLQEALNDQETKLIWALRGGYGTNHIVDQLDFTLFKKYPKIIAGFSDITLLHNKIQNLGFPSWHTFMPVNLSLPMDEEVIEQTGNAFFGDPFSYSFPVSTYNRNTKDEMAGIITGGNLSLLYSSLGTPWDINTKDKLLLIEDVGEHLYQIDRMIISMKKAGKFNQLKGLIVGQFTEIPENNPSFNKNYQNIILEHTKEFNFPVIFDFPVGHIQNNYPVIVGKNTLIRKNNNKFTFSQNSKISNHD